MRDRRRLIMLSSIRRRLSSDVLVAAPPATRRASVRLLQSCSHKASIAWKKVFLYSKTTQVSAKHTMQHSKHVSMFQTSGESCTLSRKRASHNSSYLTRVPFISFYTAWFDCFSPINNNISILDQEMFSKINGSKRSIFFFSKNLVISCVSRL